MFYELSTHNSGRFCYLTYPWDYYAVKETKCEACGRTVQDLTLKYWPPKFALEGGKRYPDLLRAVTPFEDRCGLILSERALYVFESEKIGSFRAEPIEISDNPKNAKDGSPSQMPSYYDCYVTGKISLDYVAMHYRKKKICPKCGQYTWSRQKIGESALDPATWDQSDICKLTDYPNVFICTERVVDAVKRNDLKGFAIASEKEIFLPLKKHKIC